MNNNYLSIVDHRGNPIPTGSLGASSCDFEGAATSGRLITWDYSSRGPNASLFGSLSTLRGRARGLVLNNPIAKGGVDSSVSSSRDRHFPVVATMMTLNTYRHPISDPSFPFPFYH